MTLFEEIQKEYSTLKLKECKFIPENKEFIEEFNFTKGEKYSAVVVRLITHPRVKEITFMRNNEDRTVGFVTVYNAVICKGLEKDHSVCEKYGKFIKEEENKEECDYS